MVLDGQVENSEGLRICWGEKSSACLRVARSALVVLCKELPNPVFNRSANGIAVDTRRAARAGARLTQRSASPGQASYTCLRRFP